MVSLLVLASVCVSWYHSLVSMSVRPTQFDPDPVSLLFPTPLSLVVRMVHQCVLSAQTPRFPGMLVEFRLFFQVTVVCALWGVSVNSHTGREINTLTLSHAYTNLVTLQPTPCTAKNSLALNVRLRLSINTLCPLTLTVAVCELNLLKVLPVNTELDVWPCSEWVISWINYGWRIGAVSGHTGFLTMENSLGSPCMWLYVSVVGAIIEAPEMSYMQ